MFITISKKAISIVSLCAFTLTAVVATALLKTEYVTTVPQTEYTVVIDAGHGGIDGGSVGVTTGIKESELNLAYAFNLERQLKAMGIGVIMTRTNELGLYDVNATNRKRSEMQKRKSIIDNSNADLVVSIHMNSYKLKSSYGAQVFYKIGHEGGKSLAQSIQKKFVNILSSPKTTALSGDYFLVNCTDLPSVIVECGFLSNAQEEKLLATHEYQTKVCYSVLCGILEFLNLAEY